MPIPLHIYTKDKTKRHYTFAYEIEHLLNTQVKELQELHFQPLAPFRHSRGETPALL